MDIKILEKALLKSWSRETSYYSAEWNESNPALGQCAITALIVNDYFGGDIVWSEAILSNKQKISHYFNIIDGKEVDLTRSQFPKGTIIPKGIEKKKIFISTREYLMSYEGKNSRYAILKERVEDYL
ncbi:MAG: hypothetical protein PHX30_02805 [Candidatus Pacebacteria bacterium]|jgi:hypothetical protein|nr:hypothetical protein [Candidatus Paceibacterota bacterium]